MRPRWTESNSLMCWMNWQISLLVCQFFDIFQEGSVKLSFCLKVLKVFDDQFSSFPHIVRSSMSGPADDSYLDSWDCLDFRTARQAEVPLSNNHHRPWSGNSSFYCYPDSHTTPNQGCDTMSLNAICMLISQGYESKTFTLASSKVRNCLTYSNWIKADLLGITVSMDNHFN